MTIEDLNAQIQIKHTQISVEKDSSKRQELNKQLKVLELKKEIAVIKIKIAQLS